MLALALGKSLAEIEQLTAKEIHEWMWFYSQQPFDDFNRFHRPAALIAQSVAGGEMQPRLDWLQFQPSPNTEGLSDVDMSFIRVLSSQVGKG